MNFCHYRVRDDGKTWALTVMGRGGQPTQRQSVPRSSSILQRRLEIDVTGTETQVRVQRVPPSSGILI